jgi:hypothetical protein
MAILKREEHIGIDISSAYTVLTYTRPDTAEPAIVIPRVDLGVPVGGPVVGGGVYVGHALIDGNQVTPKSSITFDAGQTKGILQGRAITIEPGDVVTIEVTGQAGDTAVNATAALHDSTPIQIDDLDGLTGSGAVEVDHDYGGTDNLRYVTSSGIGIDGATVYAFLKEDYDAGHRSATHARARSLTNVDGRWAAPMMLDPAWYVMYFYKQNAWGPDTATIQVTI